MDLVAKLCAERVKDSALKHIGVKRIGVDIEGEVAPAPRAGVLYEPASQTRVRTADVNRGRVIEQQVAANALRGNDGADDPGLKPVAAACH
jgi:hypothetical protein